MSLVLRYKFDEITASLTTDSSGNGNDLVNVGGVVSGVDATYGNVAEFNGTSSYFTLPNAPSEIAGSNPWTICLWMNKQGNDYLFFMEILLWVTEFLDFRLLHQLDYHWTLHIMSV